MEFYKHFSIFAPFFLAKKRIQADQHIRCILEKLLQPPYIILHVTWLTSPLSKRNTAPPYGRKWHPDKWAVQGARCVAVATEVAKEFLSRSKVVWSLSRWANERTLHRHFFWYEMTTEKLNKGEDLYLGVIWSAENWVWEVSFFWVFFFGWKI